MILRTTKAYGLHRLGSESPGPSRLPVALRYIHRQQSDEVEPPMYEPYSYMKPLGKLLHLRETVHVWWLRVHGFKHPCVVLVTCSLCPDVADARRQEPSLLETRRKLLQGFRSLRYKASKTSSKPRHTCFSSLISSTLGIPRDHASSQTRRTRIWIPVSQSSGPTALPWLGQEDRRCRYQPPGRVNPGPSPKHH